MRSNWKTIVFCRERCIQIRKRLFFLENEAIKSENDAFIVVMAEKYYNMAFLG